MSTVKNQKNTKKNERKKGTIAFYFFDLFCEENVNYVLIFLLILKESCCIIDTTWFIRLKRLIVTILI